MIPEAVLATVAPSIPTWLAVPLSRLPAVPVTVLTVLIAVPPTP